VVISHNASSACLIVIIWRCNYRCRADACDDISYWARDEPTRISKKPKNHQVVVKFFTHTESAELSIKIKGAGRTISSFATPYSKPLSIMLPTTNTRTDLTTQHKSNDSLNMTKDDYLLFNLNVLSSLKKFDRLKCSDGLISIDDRWPFQGIYRWWSGDSKDGVTMFLFDMMAELGVRIRQLAIHPRGADEERLIKKFATILPQARNGVMNLKYYTYDDNLTKTKFGLILDKIDDILFDLSQTDTRNFDKRCDFV
jgi:hypothetical protein